MKRARASQVVPPCHLLRRPRVNVTLTAELSDAALLRTQARIDGLLRVTGLPRLGVVLRDMRGCGVAPMERTLDLIAHASHDGILQLGGTRVAPGDRELEAFVTASPVDLTALGFTRVRLLGCYTSAGAVARDALAYVQSRLGAVAVYGCGDHIDEHNFDVDGFAPRWDVVLVRAPSTAPPQLSAGRSARQR